MPYKFCKALIKKNVEKKKKLFFPPKRKLRLFPFVRKKMPFSFDSPLAVTISTEGLTQEQIDLLKELEAKGLIPKITWIESSPNSFDDRMKYALLYLHSDEAKSLGCKILKGYDYAWIKIALDCSKMPVHYVKYTGMSTPKFVEYIRSLGYTDIAGSKTINKVMTHARWQSESNTIAFHRINISMPEHKRRNRIALKFLEIMNEV